MRIRVCPEVHEQADEKFQTQMQLMWTTGSFHSTMQAFSLTKGGRGCPSKV